MQPSTSEKTALRAVAGRGHRVLARDAQSTICPDDLRPDGGTKC